MTVTTQVRAIDRHNARIVGDQPTAMMLAHGFGCDQNMWREVAPAFSSDFRTILFDNRADLADVAAIKAFV